MLGIFSEEVLSYTRARYYTILAGCKRGERLYIDARALPDDSYRRPLTGR
jgi:hypothetical protein